MGCGLWVVEVESQSPRNSQPTTQCPWRLKFEIMNSELIPELLVNEHCACGENPLWDDARAVLYWCDIPAGKVFEWDAVSGDHRLIFQGPEMGAFTLQSDGSLLLLFVGSAAHLDPENGQLVVLKEGITRDTGRFNDCIATPRGDVFAGTVDWEQQTRGALFQLDLDGNATSICSGTACSNGLGWTPDGRGLYWSDSTAKTVYRFDYDAQSGQLSNRRVWLHTPELTPDGLTTDGEGGVWIAYFGGGCVRHYAPRCDFNSTNRISRSAHHQLHFRRRRFGRTVRHNGGRQGRIEDFGRRFVSLEAGRERNARTSVAGVVGRGVAEFVIA